MKTITIIFTFLVLCSCVDKKTKAEKEKIKYYYLFTDRHGLSIDTFKYEQTNYIDSIDELLETQYFDYRGKSHIIKMYSSDNRAAVDGGVLKFTLDSIGIVYLRPIWWPTFGRLTSNNDSINDLINATYGFILSRQQLRCFYCLDKYTHKPEPVKTVSRPEIS